jgi:hypothetical protein
MSNNNQWIRKIGLQVVNDTVALDLSSFRIRFDTTDADEESPNSAIIRVFNLSKATVNQIKGEFSEVILQAGYEQGNYGVIFRGTIKQLRVGRENPTDTFLEILAADGDMFYTSGIVNMSLFKGTTPAETINALTRDQRGIAAQANLTGLKTDKQHTPSIRGQAKFGMARASFRNIAKSLDASWSIQDGVITMLDNTGYAEDSVVVLTRNTGLIGIPEQTDGGIKLRCLLNSRLRIGGRVQVDNEAITQLMMQDPNAPPVVYNSYTGLQYNAILNNDGIYRMLVVEHHGDTRSTEWYSDLVCLDFDASDALAPVNPR